RLMAAVAERGSLSHFTRHGNYLRRFCCSMGSRRSCERKRLEVWQALATAVARPRGFIRSGCFLRAQLVCWTWRSGTISFFGHAYLRAGDVSLKLQIRSVHHRDSSGVDVAVLLDGILRPVRQCYALRQLRKT